MKWLNYLIICSILIIIGAVNNATAKEVSFHRVIDKHSSKKTDLGPRSVKQTISETADFGWYIKQYSCILDGVHGDKLSCNGNDDVVAKDASGRKFVVKASCTGYGKINGGVGNIGKTARIRCIFKGVKSNVTP